MGTVFEKGFTENILIFDLDLFSLPKKRTE